MAQNIRTPPAIIEEEDTDTDRTPLISSGESFVGYHLRRSLSNYSSIMVTSPSPRGHRSLFQDSGSKYKTIEKERRHHESWDDVTLVIESNQMSSRSKDTSFRSSISLPRRLRLPSILTNPDHKSSSNRASPSQLEMRSCLFQIVLTGVVVLEMLSLIFFATLLLYTEEFGTNYDRNLNAIGLFFYVFFMMTYGLFSLHVSFGIGVKILTALLKSFATSVFFTLSLQHVILLPMFFIYFFPAVISTCINFVLT